MRTKQYFLSIFTICTFLLSAILLFACTTVENTKTEKDEQIDVTVVPEIKTIKDEFLTVTMDELPFYVELPSGWTFTESGAYLMEFDEGASGSIQFNKTPLTKTLDELLADSYLMRTDAPEGFSIACKNASTSNKSTTYCGIKSGDLPTVYSMIIQDKVLTQERLNEIDQIIQSLKMD